jgi:signal peptidase
VGERVKLKELLKNEWVKTGIMLAIVLIAFFSFWFGLRFALATEYPLLAVASGSMVPTLNIGDLIVVRGVSNFSEIYAHPINGGIIIFTTYDPNIGQDPINLWPGKAPELIVHRAINKTLKYDSHVGREVYYFTTKGDHNPTADAWPGTNFDGVPEYYVVGRVVGVVPWVGNVPLFIRTPSGILTIFALIIIVFLAEYLFSTVREKKKPPVVVEEQV